MVTAGTLPCAEARQTLPVYSSSSFSRFLASPFSSALLSSSLLKFATNRQDISLVCTVQVAPTSPSPFPVKVCHGRSKTEVSYTHLEESGSQYTNESEGTAKSQYLTYKVREGDTLTWIANRFGTTVQSISFLNEIADINYVPAGKWLLLPAGANRPSEVIAGTGRLDTAQHPSSVDSYGSINKDVVVLVESSPPSPLCATPFSFQSFHVKLAMSVLLLLAALGIIKRCISHFQRRDEILTFQKEKDVDPHHRRKFRRWQGILDEDWRSEEAEEEARADGRTLEDLEEEKLREEYVQLQSVYIKFLEDSGLTKSGYWRGGVPPAVEEH